MDLAPVHKLPVCYQILACFIKGQLFTCLLKQLPVKKSAKPFFYKTKFACLIYLKNTDKVFI